MKVIFLDIDCVLNDDFTKEYAPSGAVFVDDWHLEILKDIIDRTDAKIVLSSDWRLDDGEDLRALKDKFAEFGLKIFSSTPDIDHGINRGVEIEAWLSTHPEVEDFVVIDDRFDMHEVLDHLVRPNPHYGLTLRDGDKVIRRLT